MDSEELVGWSESHEFDGTLVIILTHDGLDKYKRIRGRMFPTLKGLV